MKKPVPTSRPDMPVQKPRDPPMYAGDMPKTCANCEHFAGHGKAPRNQYRCRNGISGRMTTRAIDGCAFGFYPSVDRFPLQAGPGGIR